jgi:hypothetical protein
MFEHGRFSLVDCLDTNRFPVSSQRSKTLCGRTLQDKTAVCNRAEARLQDRRFKLLSGGRASRLVDAGEAVMAKALDLVLHQQFLPLEFHDSQIIDRGMGQAIVDFVFECPVTLFQFRKVRLHRHAGCLLNLWLLSELSLDQTRRKSDGKAHRTGPQLELKPLITGDLPSALERLCGKRNNFRDLSGPGAADRHRR